MAFQIVRNDITKVRADAIVNTANPWVAVGGGVDTAIYNAAGYEQLLDERKKIGELPPGEVCVTSAFNLDAKYIIHVSGPWWEGGDKGEEQLLRQCYDKALKKAAEKGCESIAFPLMSTGSYKFPKKLGMEIAVAAFTDFLLDNEMEITLVVFGSEATDISGELAYEVKNYIGDAYVEEVLSEEYGSPRYLEEEIRYSSMRMAPDEVAEEACKDVSDLDEISDGNMWTTEVNVSHHSGIHGMLGAVAKNLIRPASSKSENEPAIFEKSSLAGDTTVSLDDAIKNIYTDSFSNHLQLLINKKGLKNSQVYTAANISKQYFSKLLKGQVKPSKEKVLALAVGLRLNLDEATDFLKLAGYALSPIDQTDEVVKYFIVHENYSVMKIDIVLFDYGLDPLSKCV